MKPGIKKITDQVPILGHIKIGGKRRMEGKTSGGKPKIIPVKYDHFVVTGTNQDELGYLPDEELVKKLFADQMGILVAEHTEPIYDESGKLLKTFSTATREQLTEDNKKLTRIVVMLPFDELEENLLTSLAVYDSDGCRCRGNNETAEYVDPRTNKVILVRCPCDLLQTRLSPDDEIGRRAPHEKGLKPEPGKGMICKANGVLYLILKQARTIGGVHVFRTTSINSIRQLMFSMRQVSNLTRGFLAGIPLVLELQAKKVSPGPNKKPQTAYVVTLTRRASQNEFLRQVAEGAVLRESLQNQIATKQIKQLPAPGMENPYDAYNIREEFYNPDGEPEIEVEGEVVSDAEFTNVNNASEDAPDEAPVDTTQEQPQEAPGATEVKEPVTEAPAQEKATDEKPAVATTQEPAKVAEASAQEVAKPGEATSDTVQVDEKKAEPEKTSETAKAAEPESTVVTFGRFKPVDTKAPENADTSPASKELRKSFFEKTKTAGYTDEEVRNLLEKLWKIQSSSKLQTWQVNALIGAL